MSTVFIDPSATAPGNGTLADPFNSWYDVSWKAGNTYVQKDGTVFDSSLVITTQATSNAPITISSYGTGNAPEIDGSVLFSGASNITISGYNITNSSYAGVTITNGSHNIDIVGNVISNSNVGIWMSSSAGGNNYIGSNDIGHNQLFGVALDASNATQPNMVAYNSIHNNGGSGIEIDGNNFVIDHNLVMDNGLTVSGSSGIHTFAAGPAANSGNSNYIAFNTIIGTQAPAGVDGNGIELDEWTHNNVVYGNFTFGNDGAGIIAFGSGNNLIGANVMIGDGQDRSPGQAELAIMGAGKANSILDNITISIGAPVFAVLVDATAAALGQSLNGNIFDETGQGPNYSWGSNVGSNVAIWNALTSGDDAFTGITSILKPESTSLDWSFGSTPLTLPIDGHTVSIVGWSSVDGLIGSYS